MRGESPADRRRSLNLRAQTLAWFFERKPRLLCKSLSSRRRREKKSERNSKHREKDQVNRYYSFVCFFAAAA